MPRRSKAQSQSMHARRRANERLGIRLSDDDLRAIVAQVQSGQARFIEKQSRRISVFYTTFRDDGFFFVYDKQRQTIVTFLTKEMIAERSYDSF